MKNKFSSSLIIGSVLVLVSAGLWITCYQYSIIGGINTSKHSPGFSFYNGNVALWLHSDHTIETAIRFNKTNILNSRNPENTFRPFGSIEFNNNPSYKGVITIPFWVFLICGLALAASGLFRKDEPTAIP